jgi:hypothetical protein
MTFDFALPPYIESPRGGKLTSYKVKTLSDPMDGDALLLCGPREVAEQILAAHEGSCRKARLTDEAKKTYTHGIRFPGGVTKDVVELADMLTAVVSIPAPKNVDFAVALDWYYVPDDDQEEGIARTDMGDLINWTKHATHPEYGNSVRSRAKMLRLLVGFIGLHPLYAEASAIIAAPGHKADGQSFGEVLAREVAAKSGIPFVESHGQGARPAQKEQKQNLDDVFTVQGGLSGTVIVVDDVYQSGGSARGAAAAAIRAGATSVVSLAVARTISN